MNRTEFEALRDMPGKQIAGDIVLKRKKEGSTVFASGAVPIETGGDVPVNLNIEFNNATDCKTINVSVVGVGPICRLEVDGKAHLPAGRSHKHALRLADCPSENLPRDVIDRTDLSGLSLERVFAEFCIMAHIEHSGTVKVLE